MPRFRKFSLAEIAAQQPTPGARAQLAREYDAYVAGFAPGDYRRAELSEGDRRDTVRRQLQAAAQRRGFALRFRPGRGPLIFRVDVVPPRPPKMILSPAATMRCCRAGCEKVRSRCIVLF